MDSVYDDRTLLLTDFSIRKFTDQSLYAAPCSSPRLIAALHVLHRLPVPRHPSCALSSLTTKNYSCTSIICLYAIRLWQSCFACLYGIISLHLTSLIFNEHQSRGLTLYNLRIRGYYSIWWAYLELNQGPRPYQGRALTN